MDLSNFQFPIQRASDQVDDALFWHVIEIWWRKPHCVNKRICGADFPDRSIDISAADTDFLIAVIGKKTDGNFESRRLLPKDTKRFQSIVELIWKDDHSSTAIFLPQSITDQPSITKSENRYPHVHFPYAITLIKDDQEKPFLVLKIHKQFENDQSAKWLMTNLLPTLIRWMNHCQIDRPMTSSLRLIDLEEYNDCYNRLKANYGKRLVEIWPERTDPKKFVYEDIGTAAYLLTLWAQDRKDGRCDHMQTFVDLGCGNGLLVYLLTMEKHPGYGIDLRRRNIWDLYGDGVSLIERAFEPSDQHLFPNTDWIIGNHSDELTPWIPVIAAKSSSTCNFFVIPCCAWDFRGKYNRKDALSTYRSYLRYVKSIGQQCGFNAEDDILKIPSTKRAAIVGWRNRSIDAKSVEENIRFLLDGGGEKMETDEKKSWIDGFEHREVQEPIRNCTTLPKMDIDRMVKKIVEKILEEDRYVETKNGRWKIGGCLTIPDCAKLMDEDELQLLKSQCGGVQTLLKNHHQVFNVHQGKVVIRDWTEDSKRYRKNDKRPCWFHRNHKDGCPLTAAECPYTHVDLE